MGGDDIITRIEKLALEVNEPVELLIHLYELILENIDAVRKAPEHMKKQVAFAILYSEYSRQMRWGDKDSILI